jgi:hypothetical protein
MDVDARVCPFCGAPPGPGVFCEACGRNLSDVDQLPTRAEWERDRGALAPPAPAAADDPDALARFLATMHAAGDPGAEKLSRAEPGFLGRRHYVVGWIVRPVGGENRDEPGVFLSVDGALHRLDSATRGISNRGAAYMDLVGPETAPANGLAGALAAVLRANGLA